jgi:hypothetical protein
VIVVLVIVTWVALTAVVLDMFRVGTSTPTPEPAPRTLLAPAEIELVGQKRPVA